MNYNNKQKTLLDHWIILHRAVGVTLTLTGFVLEKKKKERNKQN